MIVFASALTCAVSAYRPTAQQRGWPLGSYYLGDLPSKIGLYCLCVLAGLLIGGISAGKLHLIWVLWAVVGYFVGGPIIIFTLKEYSQPLALYGAPLAVALSVFFLFI